MTQIAIVYHSGYGHTKQQAEAVRTGAASVAGVNAQLLPIDAEGNLGEAGWSALEAADAIIFGSPTYMGNASWQFKKFADASSAAWFTQKWKNKLAAGFTNSASMNGDKHSTLHYLITLAMQHGMVWAGTGMMPASSKAAQRDDVNFLGSSAGLMAQSPSDSSPEEGPLPGDLETAKLFGVRVAEATIRWDKGGIDSANK
jgi:NAD(P)H dehydrogenase (quinone)